MNRTDLEFLLAFADIEGLMDRPVTEVIELAVDYLNSDELMSDYLYHYRLMKEYHLDDEVKTLVRYGEYDFFMACEDWDI
mgnify:FL=1